MIAVKGLGLGALALCEEVRETHMGYTWDEALQKYKIPGLRCCVENSSPAQVTGGTEDLVTWGYV